jgi:hypothetical protein
VLWRPGYQPRVTTLSQKPTLRIRLLDGSEAVDAPVLIGGFAPTSLLEQEVWRRLVESANLAQDCIQAVFGAEPSSLVPLVPRSRWGRTGACADTSEWEALVQPDHPGRSFAVSGPMMVVGPPTEEVWEEFEAIARRSAARSRAEGIGNSPRPE